MPCRHEQGGMEVLLGRKASFMRILSHLFYPDHLPWGQLRASPSPIELLVLSLHPPGNLRLGHSPAPAHCSSHSSASASC